MATANDITILSEKMNTLGKDVCEKQRIITEKAEQGRKHMNLLKMGTDFYIKEKEYNELIMNLLHYKQYTFVAQQFFLRWDEIDDSFSEQAYIDTGNFAKQMYDDFNEELFEITMTDLLFYKSNGDENKIDKLFSIYDKLIGNEWLDAKFLKSLKK